MSLPPFANIYTSCHALSLSPSTTDKYVLSCSTITALHDNYVEPLLFSGAYRRGVTHAKTPTKDTLHYAPSSLLCPPPGGERAPALGRTMPIPRRTPRCPSLLRSSWRGCWPRTLGSVGPRTQKCRRGPRCAVAGIYPPVHVRITGGSGEGANARRAEIIRQAHCACKNDFARPYRVP